MELFMALRYPLDAGTNGKGLPFILFTSHRAQYKPGARETTLTDNKSTAMYMPPGFQVADIMRYESASPGLMGGIAENLMNGNNNYTAADAMEVASLGVGAGVQGVVAAAGVALGSGGVGALIGAEGASSTAAAAEALRAKRRQNIVNPNEFMLFRAPGVRQFSFTFNMMPSSAAESNETKRIIQYFRERMYPTLANNDLLYNFPEVFTIKFKNIDGIPKIAESALTNASTTYNPNSMSYFKHHNRPVEIGLTLSFQEMMPLSAKNIKDGF